MGIPRPEDDKVSRFHHQKLLTIQLIEKCQILGSQQILIRLLCRSARTVPHQLLTSQQELDIQVTGMDLRAALLFGGCLVISQDQKSTFAIQIMFTGSRLSRQQSQCLGQIVTQTIGQCVNMGQIINQYEQ